MPVYGAIIARLRAWRNCLPLKMDPIMWIEKLIDGVLQVDTPIGPRYVQPTLIQRACLIWIFRNFVSLPQQVLRPWQRQLIERLWSENRFVSLSVAGGADRLVIGQIERRMPSQAEVIPIRKPPVRETAASSSSTVGEQTSEAASA